MPKLAGRAYHGRSPASSGTVRRGAEVSAASGPRSNPTPGQGNRGRLDPPVESRTDQTATPTPTTSRGGTTGGVAVPSLVLPTEYAGDVAVDTETNGLFADDGARVAIVSVAWWHPSHRDNCPEYCYSPECVEAYSFPFDQGVRDKPGRGKRFQLDLFQDDDINLPEVEWSALLVWLSDQDLVMANAVFDLEKLRVGTRHWAGIELEDQVVWDTMLGNKELDPQYPTGLKPSTERLFGDTSDEQSALKPYLGPKEDPRFDLVPWDVIEPYATWDAIKTLRLAAQQRDRIHG